MGRSIRRLGMTCVAFFAACMLACADPVGTYSMTGSNPETGSPYKGQVSVIQTGDTYRVVWNVGQQQIIGVGMLYKNFFSVAYRLGNAAGIAFYTEEGNDWAGVWALIGGSKLGTERWTRSPKRQVDP